MQIEASGGAMQEHSVTIYPQRDHWADPGGQGGDYVSTID